MDKNFNVDENNKAVTAFINGRSLTELMEDKTKSLKQKLSEPIPCNNCQGGGCPVCSGSGWITN